MNLSNITSDFIISIRVLWFCGQVHGGLWDEVENGVGRVREGVGISETKLRCLGGRGESTVQKYVSEGTYL